MEHVERKDVVLVQCKHTSRDEKYLGEAPIKEVLWAAGHYPVQKGHRCVAITNATGFSQAARDHALENDVILVDRNNLALWPNHIV